MKGRADPSAAVARQRCDIDREPHERALPAAAPKALRRRSCGSWSKTHACGAHHAGRPHRRPRGGRPVRQPLGGAIGAYLADKDAYWRRGVLDFARNFAADHSTRAAPFGCFSSFRILAAQLDASRPAPKIASAIVVSRLAAWQKSTIQNHSSRFLEIGRAHV